MLKLNKEIKEAINDKKTVYLNLGNFEMCEIAYCGYEGYRIYHYTLSDTIVDEDSNNEWSVNNIGMCDDVDEIRGVLNKNINSKMTSYSIENN